MINQTLLKEQSIPKIAKLMLKVKSKVSVTLAIILSLKINWFAMKLLNTFIPKI